MISVIITTKNRLDFLIRAVNSVVKNSLKPIDIVIVNDGGDSVKLDDFDFDLDMDIAINIINNPVSLGGNKARNQGATAAQGDYLFFLDDDDAYTENTISDKIKVFTSNPNIGLVFTGVKYVYSNSLGEVRRIRLAKNKTVSLNDLLANGNVVGPTSCAAVRKSFFVEVGMFDENLHAMQDYELWIRMAKRSVVINDGGVNLIYTIHSLGSQVSSKYEKYISAAKYISDKFTNDLNQLKVVNMFWGEVYFRIALSSSHTSSVVKLRFALKSFLCKPSFKSLALILPTWLLKKLKPFV